MSTHNQPPENPMEEKQEVTFLTILLSVFASFFGVQKDANRRRDFASGKFWHFFAAGLIFVLVFLLSVWGLVQYLLATTPTGQ
jgi:hypothetical protein